MVTGTRTNDMVAGADLSVTIADGDTFIITPVLRTFDMLIILSGAATTTITFNAGAEPPSMRATMGSQTFAIANSEVRAMLLEGGRHMQLASSGNQNITGSNSGGNVKMAAYRIPRIKS